MRIRRILICFLLASAVGRAQQPIHYAIKYEKKVNLVNLYTRWDMGRRARFYVDSFLLKTNCEQATYTRLDNPNGAEGYFASHMYYNNVFVDIKKKQQITQKEVSDGTFLLVDSLPNLKWKMTTESRSILGFECYKAMAKFQDSITIVAYYTTQLQAPIGPESVHGLPGTIMGLVVPVLHTTWLAKSFQNLDATPIKDFAIPTKGKKVNKEELRSILLDAFKQYDNIQSIMIRVLL
jgi:GLPGLI family protein